MFFSFIQSPLIKVIRCFNEFVHVVWCELLSKVCFHLIEDWKRAPKFGIKIYGEIVYLITTVFWYFSNSLHHPMSFAYWFRIWSEVRESETEIKIINLQTRRGKKLFFHFHVVLCRQISLWLYVHVAFRSRPDNNNNIITIQLGDTFVAFPWHITAYAITFTRALWKMHIEKSSYYYCTSRTWKYCIRKKGKYRNLVFI